MRQHAEAKTRESDWMEGIKNKQTNRQKHYEDSETEHIAQRASAVSISGLLFLYWGAQPSTKDMDLVETPLKSHKDDLRTGTQKYTLLADLTPNFRVILFSEIITEAVKQKNLFLPISKAVKDIVERICKQ